MKKLEFETSKGNFVLLDVDYNSMTFVRILDTCTACLGSEEIFDYTESFKLSEITEEKASEVVDDKEGNSFTDYEVDPTENEGYYYKHTAIESLQSLIKSKGIHLYENPYKDVGLMPSYEQKLYRDANYLTFYNPYLFKLK